MPTLACNGRQRKKKIISLEDGHGSLVKYEELNSHVTNFYKRIFGQGKSRLEGMNRRNLKIMNFEHALCPGLALELNRSVEDSSPYYKLLNQCE
jgi:hypothetical protein